VLYIWIDILVILDSYRTRNTQTIGRIELERVITALCMLDIWVEIQELNLILICNFGKEIYEP